MPLVWRALLAFLALPFVVAGVIPWFFIRPGAPRVLANGMPFIALGLGLLLWCVREFYVAGKGTLAPWDPPRHLVTSGPYRHTRNPMYVAVLLILAGWALSLDVLDYRTPLHYAVLVGLLFHLRVLTFEEPWARRTFGEEWERYRATVPRWFFRDSPFLELGLFALLIGLLGHAPPGWDYDPHPIREPLTSVFAVLGFPGLVVRIFVWDTLWQDSRVATTLGHGVFLLPYLLLDVLWRRFRRRSSPVAARPTVNQRS